MLLFWKIRYLDRADRQFKDRCLYLLTDSLEPVIRARVELIAESKSSRTERDIFKYRHLFKEAVPEEGPASNENPTGWTKTASVGPSEYFEDETGKELSGDEMAQILTGSPTARMVPRAPQHYIDFAFSEPKPSPVEASLTSDEIRLLAYFLRDIDELSNSAFMKDGPGKLNSSGTFRLSATSNHSLETAVTDEEIRSFVTIFRRLYMTGHHDPASFTKAVPIFVKAMNDNPYGKLVDGIAKAYQKHLDSEPESWPFLSHNLTFNTKRLIDVYLYTQYAHQPNEVKERQYYECLQQVYGNRPTLMWIFLTEMWKLSLEIRNAGNIISQWFRWYCNLHGVTPNILNSLRDDLAGLGAGEKQEDREARLLREKTEELSIALWEQYGKPVGGPTQFLSVAKEQLAKLI